MGAVTAGQVQEALCHVIDPELGINIVDLGLVYRVSVEEGRVHVVMTMTTPACPLGESLTEQAEATIWQNVPGVKSVAVDLAWEPPWHPSMMSDGARKQLGWAG